MANQYTAKDKLLIRTFVSTYNARYLRDFEGPNWLKRDKIERLYTALKIKNRPVLLKLVWNLLVYHIESKRPFLNIKPDYNIENIEGPHYLKKLKLKQEGKNEEIPLIKTVYIYGETHQKEVYIDGSCPKPSTRFNQYLNLLREKSPAFTDIYLELSFSKAEHTLYTNDIIINQAFADILNKVKTDPAEIHNIVLFEELRNSKQRLLKVLPKAPKTETSPHTSFMLGQLEKDLFKCIAPRYDRSYCKTIRVHSIDMRRSVQNDTLIDVIPKDYITVLECIYILLDFWYKPSYFNSNRNKRRTITNLIKIINNEFTVVNQDGDDVSLLEELISIMKNNPEGLIEAFRKVPKIERQHRLSYERENIDNFFRLHCSSKSSHIISVGTILEKFLSATDTNSIPTHFEVNSLSLSLLYTHSIIMDYYAMLRIFKDYFPREKKLPTDPEPLDHPLRSNNIIIYAGVNHCITYFDFFKSIGFQPFFEYENPKINCVNTKQPIVKGSKKRTVENIDDNDNEDTHKEIKII